VNTEGLSSTDNKRELKCYGCVSISVERCSTLSLSLSLTHSLYIKQSFINMRAPRNERLLRLLSAVRVSQHLLRYWACCHFDVVASRMSPSLSNTLQVVDIESHCWLTARWRSVTNGRTERRRPRPQCSRYSSAPMRDAPAPQSGSRQVCDGNALWAAAQCRPSPVNTNRCNVGKLTILCVAGVNFIVTVSRYAKKVDFDQLIKSLQICK